LQQPDNPEQMKIRKNLQKILILVILSGFTMTVSYGQAALIILILGDKVATEKFHLSMDGALNLTSFQNPGQGKSNLGINFGLGTHLKLGEKWNLQVEFKPLSQKGARSVNQIVLIPSEIEEGNTRLKLNYIDVPVMIQYNIVKKLSVAAGPQISFLTKVSQVTDGTISGGNVSIKQDTKSLYNNIDFSLPVELRYFISLHRKNTKVDVDIFVRYSYGFKEIYKDPAVGSAHISAFQFGLSFPFIKTAEELAATKKK
jgi:Outer membrane protein beta-barrel domain